MVSYRTDLWAAWLLAGFVAVCFGRLLLAPDSLIANPADPVNDAVRQYAGLRSFPAEAWARSGQWPLWNPTLHGGAPLLANPQSALFYPPNLLFIWPGGLAALSWSFALHTWIRGLGTYAAARRYGLSSLAAFAAGAADAAAPYLMGHVYEGHHPHVCAAAWIPWAWWAYEGVRQGRRAAAPALSGFFALAFLAGHVQECYYLCLVIGLAVVLDTLMAIRASGWSSWVGAARLPGRVALAGLVAMGLSAVQFVPQVLAHPQTVLAGGLSLRASSSFCTTPVNLWQLLCPFALGNPIDNDYTGPWNYWESQLSVGLTTLFLGVAGWWPCRGSHRKGGQLRLLLIAVFALWFALGRKAGLFAWLYTIVPGVGWFRCPGRMLFWLALAAALQAGFGVERLLQWRLRLGRAGPAIVVAALALLLLERAVEGLYLLRVIPVDTVVIGDLGIAAVRDGVPCRVFARPGLANDATAYALGLHKLTGYEAFQLRTSAELFWEFAGRGAAAARERYDRDAAADRRLPLLTAMLDLWSVWYLILDDPATLAGWHALARDRPSAGPAVLVRDDPMPRAYVVPHARVVPEPSAARHAAVHLDPRRQVVLPADPLPSGPRQPFTPAQIRSYTSNRVELTVTMSEPGYLILADAWAPGWTATADGRLVTILQANCAQRAIALGRGSHSVVFQYWPPGFSAGCAISLATILALLALVVARLVRRQPEASRREAASP
jgi:hypothetical protein